jgi:hypothetical protein
MQFSVLVSFKTLLLTPLKAELNPTCHLLALLGAHHILHVSEVRAKYVATYIQTVSNCSRTTHATILCEESFGLRFYVVFLSP